MKTKNNLWAIVLLACPFDICGAQTTTRATGKIPLDGSRGMPMANFKLPQGVTVDKTLTVDKATGEVTQQCKFNNASAEQVDFLLCNMVALNSTFPTTMSKNTCNITQIGSRWACVKGNDSLNPSPPSFHFGCTEVHLGPGESFTAPSTNGSNSQYVGRVAADFDVSYADVFDLRGVRRLIGLPASLWGASAWTPTRIMNLRFHLSPRTWQVFGFCIRYLSLTLLIYGRN
jgi:hypothetical protein